MDKRHQLRGRLQHIHDEFATVSGEGGESGPEAGIIERLASTVERSHFEQYCLAVGRGETPFSLSGRLESFMRDEDHVRECREAAKVEIQIEELERKIAKRADR